MTEVDYGYGEYKPKWCDEASDSDDDEVPPKVDAATDYGYETVDYGYGNDAAAMGYGDDAAAMGYGDAQPEYGYGDEPEQPQTRQPVKRRCSVTKYSLASPPAATEDEKSVAPTEASRASSTDGDHEVVSCGKKVEKKAGMMSRIRKRLSIAF